jgi:hypothetical protein
MTEIMPNGLVPAEFLVPRLRLETRMSGKEQSFFTGSLKCLP